MLQNENPRDRLSLLLERWKAEDVSIAQPCTLDTLSNFETRNSILLPSDVRQYFLAVNGMSPKAPGDIDSEGFCFWPLERMVSVSDEAMQRPAHKSSHLHSELKHYFIFADYLQSSWAYAIRLGLNRDLRPEVVKVDDPDNLIRIANSFSEFLDLYLSNAPDLYYPSGISRSYRND
jgi:hypothetical protein